MHYGRTFVCMIHFEVKHLRKQNEEWLSTKEPN